MFTVTPCFHTLSGSPPLFKTTKNGLFPKLTRLLDSIRTFLAFCTHPSNVQNYFFCFPIHWALFPEHGVWNLINGLSLRLWGHVGFSTLSVFVHPQNYFPSRHYRHLFWQRRWHSGKMLTYTKNAEKESNVKHIHHMQQKYWPNFLQNFSMD